MSAGYTEEHEFWKTHGLGPGMFQHVEPDPLLEQIPTRPRAERTRPVPMCFDKDTLRPLRTLAARKGTDYQTLLKTLVMERLH